MRKIILIVFVFCCTLGGFSQTATLLNFYNNHYLIYNPAYTSKHNTFFANVGARRSWVGVTGAPTVFNLDFGINLKDQRSLLGYAMQTERVGAITQTNALVCYNYTFDLSEESSLSLGVQAGVLLNSIRWDELTPFDTDDPSYKKSDPTSTVFDANIGAFYHGYGFRASFAVKHLTQAKFGTFENPTTLTTNYSQLRTNFLFGVDYLYEIDDFWQLRPEGYLLMVPTVPLCARLGAQVIYDRRFLVGLAYISGQQTLAFPLEYQINQHFKIGYCYSASLGKIRKVQNGSHEVTLLFKLPNNLNHKVLDTETETDL